MKTSPFVEQDSRPRNVPAWLLSLLVHSTALALLLFSFVRMTNGVGEVDNKTGGIVLVDQTNETTEYLDEGDVDDSASDKSQQTPAPALMTEELPPSLPGLEVGQSEIAGVGEDFSDALTGAQEMTFGNGSGSFGGKVTTDVFGVKGTGSRFVYVFDRSASMEDLGGKPLRAAKRQLIESLDSLGNAQQFQIIFYNVKTKTFNGSLGQGLSFATDDEKKRAGRFVDAISGEGGTDHLNALQLALSYGPDVLFLLTDAEGGFSFSDLNQIGNWNRAGTVINAIEFGIGAKKSFDQSLRQVAEQSGGQYVYKDVRSFRN